MRIIFSYSRMLYTCILILIFQIAINQSEVMAENIFIGKYTRIVIKADTTWIPNNFRSINMKQIRHDNLRNFLQKYGVKTILPVYKNRYNTSGHLKENHKEKDSWYTFTTVLRKPKAFVEKLKSFTGIANAYIEYPIVPNASNYAFSFGSDQWFLDDERRDYFGNIISTGINIKDAWNINKGRSDVIIAVCDGGVDYNHPNLDPGDRSRVIAGYDTGSDDNDPMDDLIDVSNSYANHGTHIAGIIGANPTQTHHISGVMQNCRIMPVKVVGSGGIKYPFKDIYAWDFSTTAFPSDIADGIDYAVNHGAHIINLSIGFWFPNIPLIDVTTGLNVLISAINNAYNNNVLVVASMGNEGNNGSPDQFPAKINSVLAVGATNKSQQKANFSSIGSHISVCAPGVDILSTIRNNNTVTKNGTSMAAPIVSGLAGLIISQGKDRGFNLTNDDIRRILELTADDVGTPGFDNQTGYGVVNAYTALQLLSSPNNLIHGVSYGGSYTKINTLSQWILSSPCYGLAAGSYLSVDQYQITKHITFATPFLSDPVVWLRSRESLALSFATTNDGYPFVEITNITNTGFDIRYAAYYVRYNLLGKAVNKWIPENLSLTKVAYTAVGVPSPSLTGPTQICNQSTYTINNLPQGSTVNWIGSRALSIVSGQGTNSVVCQKTMFAITGSTLILRAIITFPTGQTMELTKNIFVGTYPPAILLCPATDIPPFAPHVEFGYTNENYYLFAHGENMSNNASDYLWRFYSSNPFELPVQGIGRYIEFSKSIPGEYQVSVQYNGECGWSPEVFRNIRFEDNLNVNLYPNPANDILTAELTSNQTKSSANLLTSNTNFDTYTIQLWNEYQGHVRSFEIIESKQQLSLQGLPSGMYIALIIKDGKTHQRKIVWKN